jgi:tetratricopeptide (TPR) repeat protein
MGGEEVPPSIRLKNEGDNHWRADRTTDAIIAWSRAIASHDCPDDILPSLYSNRAAAHIKLGNGREAKNDADVCVLMKPDWAKGHMRLGKALMLLNNPQDALLSFRRAAELEPDNREYLAAVNDARYHTSRSGNNATSSNYSTTGTPPPPPQQRQQQQRAPPPPPRHTNEHQGYHYVGPPWYQPYLLWINQNQRMIMQFGMIMVGVWFLMGSGVINMDAGFGGEIGTVLVVAGGIYGIYLFIVYLFQ